jgi:hypothetical protein
MYAYALNASSGSLVWKSAKLPGYGFHSYWPVVYRDYVVFNGGWNLRMVGPAGIGDHNLTEREEVYPADADAGDPVGPYGEEPGDWVAGTTTIRASSIINYFEEKPYRRTYFMLNRFTGKEYTFDSDGDGRQEYAPILYYGAKNGVRYPPSVGLDGVIYQTNNYVYSGWIPRGQVSGWKLGTPHISVPAPYSDAVDEPLGHSIGGNIVYTRLCCDRELAAFDLATGESWMYYDQGGNPLRRTLPDLFAEGWDYAYWKHGNASGPVPYNGRVYTITNNAVVAFSANGQDPVLPPNQDLGDHLGVPASTIERNTSVDGLNLKVTTNSTTWPLIIYQERYYEINSSTSTRTTYSSLFEVAGSTSTQPSALTSSETNITTNLVSTFSGSQTLRTWISKRAPALLFQNSSSTYQLRGNLTAFAYPTANGIQVAQNNATISGSLLSESWILVWDSSTSHRWMPVVISLQNRPSQITATASSLTLTYSGASGYMGLTPLYGMSSPRTTESTTWMQGIPTATAERVRQLNRIARYFPSSSTETTSINNANGDVTKTYTYTYIQFTDTWNTNALRLAYLPTRVALAAWGNSPIRVNELALSQQTDLNYVTPLGRVAGVANASTATVRLPGLATYWRSYQEPGVSVNQSDPLRTKLISEIEKMVAAGHLRPGYGAHGIWDSGAGSGFGQYLADYFHNPAETIYTLLRALPFLPSDLQADVLAYLQSEYRSYPVHSVSHFGWATGTTRNLFDLPVEVEAEASSFRACDVCNSYGFPGENFYASWLYARQFGGAAGIFSELEGKLEELPVYNQSFPSRLNTRITGYIGYIKLASLANVSISSDIEHTLADLLILRAALSKFAPALEATGFEYGGYEWSVRIAVPFSEDTLFTPNVAGSLWNQMPLYGFPLDNVTGLSGGETGGGYSFGIDFLSLVPELAGFLDGYAHNEVQGAVDSYVQRAPYWFIPNAEEMGGEGVKMPIYDTLSIFQAKAMILDASRADLEMHLDVPVTGVGDLYYIQNLIATLRASP